MQELNDIPRGVAGGPSRPASTSSARGSRYAQGSSCRARLEGTSCAPLPSGINGTAQSARYGIIVLELRGAWTTLSSR